MPCSATQRAHYMHARARPQVLAGMAQRKGTTDRRDLIFSCLAACSGAAQGAAKRKRNAVAPKSPNGVIGSRLQLQRLLSSIGAAKKLFPDVVKNVLPLLLPPTDASHADVQGATLKFLADTIGAKPQNQTQAIVCARAWTRARACVGAKSRGTFGRDRRKKQKKYYPMRQAK